MNEKVLVIVPVRYPYKPVTKNGSRIAVLAIALWTMIYSQNATAGAIASAAEAGDIESIRGLLRTGADVDEPQGDGMTALHWAAEKGDAALTQMLIYAGANISAGTRIGGYTPLHIASLNGHAEVLKLLLAVDADPAAPTHTANTQPLHLAAASANSKSLKILLDRGVDVNAREGAWGQTALTFAASAGRVENVRLLLAAGADPAITSNVIDTAEMERGDQAANQRLVAILADFKEKAAGGADWLPAPNEVQGAIAFSREIQRKWPHVPDPACDINNDPAASRFSRSALPGRCNETKVTGQLETNKEPEEIRRLSYGELVGHWGGLTPLLHAVRQGHKEVVSILLDEGANINQASGSDNTSPLLMSAINGQWDITLTLLERGADPNFLSDAGTSALFAVIERQWAPWSHYAKPVDYRNQNTTHLGVMSALLEAGANPNVRLKKHLWYAEFTSAVLPAAGLYYDGATPFWRAAQALDVDAMRLLIQYGADTHVATKKIPERKRRRANPEDGKVQQNNVPQIPVGGPYVYPIHAAAGAGYGQYFMAHAHRHVPDNWLPAVKFLVEECGFDVNLRDANGYTPLHHAAARGDNRLIHYLIEQGADVEVISHKGQTTVDMANGPTQRVSPFPETIALLENMGATNNHNCVSC